MPVNIDEFTANNNDAILDGNDNSMMLFAKQELNYNHSKGLDFVARFNNKMYKNITQTYGNYNIMSSLVLRDFLYQI